MERNTIAEMRQILDAIEQEKKIQYKCLADDKTYEWSDYAGNTPNFFSFRYRIKPEKKLRPFKDVDEFIKAAGGFGAIWLKSKPNGRIEIVTIMDGRSSFPIRLASWFSFNDLLERYTFADGRPCGVEEDA